MQCLVSEHSCKSFEKPRNSHRADWSATWLFDDDRKRPQAKSLEMLRFQVDFNARDDNDAIRLSWSDERRAIDGTLVPMSEGLEAYITDDEVAAVGRVTLRDGIWVVVVSQWLGDAL